MPPKKTSKSGEAGTAFIEPRSALVPTPFALPLSLPVAPPPTIVVTRINPVKPLLPPGNTIGRIARIVY